MHHRLLYNNYIHLYSYLTWVSLAIRNIRQWYVMDVEVHLNSNLLLPSSEYLGYLGTISVSTNRHHEQAIDSVMVRL